MKTREPFAGRAKHVDAFMEQLDLLSEVPGFGVAGGLVRFAIRWALEPERTQPYQVRSGLWPVRQFRDIDPVVPVAMDPGDIAYVVSLDGKPAKIDVRHQVSYLYLHRGRIAFMHEAALGGHPFAYGLDFLPPEERALRTRQVGDLQISTVSAGVQGLFDERGQGGRRYDQPIAEYAGFLARIGQRAELAHELASAEAAAAVRGLDKF